MLMLSNGLGHDVRIENLGRLNEMYFHNQNSKKFQSYKERYKASLHSWLMDPQNMREASSRIYRSKEGEEFDWFPKFLT